MTVIRYRHESKVTFASLRQLTGWSVLMAIAIVISALSMGKAHGAAFMQLAETAPGHCATVDVADDAIGQSVPDSAHPASKAMNCGMTCVFVVPCEVPFEGSGDKFGSMLPFGQTAPFAGIGHHLDLPPPKG